MAKTIIGLFEDKYVADHAIEELLHYGYSNKEISLIMKEEKKIIRKNNNVETSVTEGAASGAVGGGVIGGIAGLLVGIGAIAVPGFGAILIAGPIAAALGLTGAAATTVSGAITGAVAGGLVGSLVGLGIPEEEAHVYEQEIREGAVLIAVPATNAEQDFVRELMGQTGAIKIRVIDTNPHEEDVRGYYPPFVGAKGGKRVVNDKYDDEF